MVAKDVIQAVEREQGFLTAREVGEAMGLSREQIRQMRLAGNGPPCVQMGPRTFLYPRVSFHEWLKVRIDRARDNAGLIRSTTSGGVSGDAIAATTDN